MVRQLVDTLPNPIPSPSPEPEPNQVAMMRQLVDAMLAARAVPPPPQPSLSALGSPAELPPRSTVLRHLVARLQCGLDPATQARHPSHHDRLPTTTFYLPRLYHEHPCRCDLQSSP